MKRNWYVYHLVDPRNGEVFYVGKGTKNRIAAHEKEAKRRVTSDKCNRIREIWESDLPVERRVAAVFTSEVEALNAEKAHIRKHVATLCNVVTYKEATRSKVMRVGDDAVLNALRWISFLSRGFTQPIRAIDECGDCSPEHGLVRAMFLSLNGTVMRDAAQARLSDLVERRGVVWLNEWLERRDLNEHIEFGEGGPYFSGHRPTQSPPSSDGAREDPRLDACAAA